MKYAHLYTGPDGKSHFKDVELFPDDKDIGSIRAEPMKATGISFVSSGKDYDLDWHNAPRRQFVITVEGMVEITASDGTVRRFGPGGIMLADDLTGQGHKSRALNNQNRRAVFITLG